MRWLTPGARARIHIYMAQPDPDPDRRRLTNYPIRLSALERAILEAAAAEVQEVLASFVRRAALSRATAIMRELHNGEPPGDDTDEQQKGTDDDE